MSAALVSLVYASLVARLPLAARVRLRLAEGRLRTLRRTAAGLWDSLEELPWLVDHLHDAHTRLGALEAGAVEARAVERARALLLDLAREHTGKPAWSKRCACEVPALGPVHAAPRSALFASPDSARYCTLCGGYRGPVIALASGLSLSLDQAAWLLERLTAEGDSDA